MSVTVIAIASDSGVPIFSRRRGNNDNVRGDLTFKCC